MALIGYDPNPNGGYRFRKDDGSSMLAFGPEAERLKSWIDQTRPADRRLAENDMPPPETQEQLTARLQARAQGDLDSDAARRAQLAHDADPATQWAKIGQFDAQGNKIGPGTAEASSAPVPAPVPAPAAATAPYYRVGPKKVPIAPADLMPAPQPSGPVRVPAPHQQPTSEANLPPMIPPTAQPPGGSMPVTAGFPSAPVAPSGGGKPKMVLAERTTEGLNQTPEEAEATRKMLEARQAADDADLAQIKAAANEKQAAMEEQSADAADAALDAHDRQLRAQDQAAAVEQAWNKTYAGLQKEQDAAANQRIDPRRLFNGENGTLNTITSALAVGLGAFGSALTGGPNYAHQMVQASIDRDINAQADAIHAKREQANNALSNFMKVHGLDVNEAKLAVRAIAQEYAANLAQIRANQINTPQAKQDAAELQLKWRAESQKNWGDLANSVKAKETDKYKMSGGASGPAWEWRTGPDGKSRLINYKTGHIEQTSDEAGVYNTGGMPKNTAPKEGDVIPRLVQSESSVGAVLPALDHYDKLSSEAGTSFGQALDKVGVGRTTELTQAAQNMAYLAARAESGGNVPPEGREKQIFENLMSPSQRTREAQAKEIRAIAGNIHRANVEVSGRTAKVGAIDGSGDVDQSGGGN